MKTPKYAENMTRHNIFIPDDLWNELVAQARIVSMELGRYKSASDLIRIATQEMLAKLRR
jgi:Arc/MetJ-type ribon-helix-helix transcriptional regulator